MSRDEIARKLAEIKEELDKEKVASLHLFGSVARGEDTESSDVDLVVEFEPGARVSLFTLARVKILIEDHLGRKVDLVPRDSIHPALKDIILAECQHVA